MKTKQVVKKKYSEIERTTLGLRECLFEEIDGLRNGTSTPQQSNAIARSAAAIIGTVKLEMDFRKLGIVLAKKGQIKFNNKDTLVLGKSES